MSAYVAKQTGAKVKLGFKPTITEEPAEPLDKVIIAFFQTQIQVPLAEDGTTWCREALEGLTRGQGGSPNGGLIWSTGGRRRWAAPDWE